MCGIVGIASDNNCIPALLSGLQALEYRGYDSSGIVSSIHNHLTYQKSIGKIWLINMRNMNTVNHYNIHYYIQQK